VLPAPYQQVPDDPAMGPVMMRSKMLVLRENKHCVTLMDLVSESNKKFRFYILMYFLSI
jgi:hypothetical protein